MAFTHRFNIMFKTNFVLICHVVLLSPVNMLVICSVDCHIYGKNTYVTNSSAVIIITYRNTFFCNVFVMLP